MVWKILQVLSLLQQRSCEAFSRSCGCCGHVIFDGARNEISQVQAVTIHATNNYFVTASLDSTWCFYDLASGLCLTRVEDASGSSEGYTSSAFHPDGLILGTGTTGATVKIWDVNIQANVARFDGHIGAVNAISFSENGYFLATAAQDGVKLRDLRKLRNFRTFSPYEENTPTQSAILGGTLYNQCQLKPTDNLG